VVYTFGFVDIDFSIAMLLAKIRNPLAASRRLALAGYSFKSFCGTQPPLIIREVVLLQINAPSATGLMTCRRAPAFARVSWT